MVDLQTISLIVQMVGVSATATAAVVGVSSYINSNKRAEEAKQKEQDTRNRELETRQAQIFINVNDKIQSKEFQSAYYKVVKTSWSTWEEYSRLYRDKLEFRDAEQLVQGIFEGLGVLVREGLLPIRMVALLLCGMTRLYWEKHIPMLAEGRRMIGSRRLYSENEYLYDELMKYLGIHPELDTRIEKPII
jgi:hypothetical protein